MKKFILVISIMVLTALFFNEVVYGIITGDSKNDAEILASLSRKLIRFHVIANSDSAEDQKLKLKVKDEVLKLIAPELKKSDSIEESREILKKYDGKIRETAEKVIKKNGYNYGVSSTLSRENFPVKTYGSITLPQGNYEAYRILIGEAKGKNWWCVMFPPLCFVDITKGEIADKETAAEMKRVLNNEEYDYVNNQNNNIELKFKVVELYNKMKEMIMN